MVGLASSIWAYLYFLPPTTRSPNLRGSLLVCAGPPLLIYLFLYNRFIRRGPQKKEGQHRLPQLKGDVKSFPAGSAAESTCQGRRRGFDPRSREITHAAEHPRLSAKTGGPVLCGLGATTTEPRAAATEALGRRVHAPRAEPPQGAARPPRLQTSPPPATGNYE